MSSTREGMIDAGAQIPDEPGPDDSVGFQGHAADCEIALDGPCNCGKRERDLGVTAADLEGLVENLTDHAAGCELREKLGGCTCGLLTRPGAPPEPTAADLPDGDYAIAELFGHCTMVGRFAEVERFGAKMLALEPIWQSKLLPPVFMGGASIYRFTPCSKEVAFAHQPTERYQLPSTVAAIIPGPALPYDGDPDFAEVDEEEQP